MQFQIARLQEIITKVQFSCKMNFKNAVDVEILLEIDGLDVLDINKLISAGIRKIGVGDYDKFLEIREHLLPCKKVYIGELNDKNIEQVLNDFEIIEGINSLEVAIKLSDLSARKSKIIEIIISINLVNDDEKFGLLPENFDQSVNEIIKLSGIRVRGFCFYSPAYGNSSMTKKLMRKASILYKLVYSKYRGIKIFSVNLQDKVDELIQEGVTEIRIGVKSLT